MKKHLYLSASPTHISILEWSHFCHHATFHADQEVLGASSTADSAGSTVLPSKRYHMSVDLHRWVLFSLFYASCLVCDNKMFSFHTTLRWHFSSSLPCQWFFTEIASSSQEKAVASVYGTLYYTLSVWTFYTFKYRLFIFSLNYASWCAKCLYFISQCIEYLLFSCIHCFLYTTTGLELTEEP